MRHFQDRLDWDPDARILLHAAQSFKPGNAVGMRLSGGGAMSNHVYKTVELVGSSALNPEDAIRRAVTRAAETVRNLRWFEVTETRGHIENGQIAHWQVTLKVGFTLEE